ncbi:cytochrome P450 [Fomitopsis serialis]|uniref:cytochrome P450 n=1 Tax=Fomitopsis serialis TaxID=139415 RepID=UPI0020073976|nr:cytochrome P450 [Neoantrodia serialis]KAH9923674.1 cytochrome P450 [Neoantrodia serialis]
MEHPYLLAITFAICFYGVVKRRASDDIFARPKEAYASALQAYGSVIAVHRKGNLEYIVGPEYARYVLTCDKLFSFEQGSAAIMNLQPLMALTQGALFQDLNDFVREGIIARMDEFAVNADRRLTMIVVFPIYDRDGQSFVDAVRLPHKTQSLPDSFLHSRDTISEATLILLLGDAYVSDRNMRIIEDVSNGMAELTGQVNVILIKIPFGFVRQLGPQLWADMNRYEAMIASGIPTREEPKNVLYFIVKTYSPNGRRIGLLRRIYICVLLLCLIFAAVHTTTVVSQWVLFQLASHPDYLAPLRQELLRIREEDDTGAMRLTAASLREAHLLDSFIREVMRLKGDTISTMRCTTCDAPLGEYVIPKGSYVTPMSCMVHENPETFGDEASDFNGFQWAEQSKDAAMTGAAHIVFGLGRFACPGRVLAINEIKLIVLCLIGRATPSLLEGRFEVTDPLNTVTQPPKGTLLFTPLEQPLL